MLIDVELNASNHGSALDVAFDGIDEDTGELRYLFVQRGFGEDPRVTRILMRKSGDSQGLFYPPLSPIPNYPSRFELPIGKILFSGRAVLATQVHFKGSSSPVFVLISFRRLSNTSCNINQWHFMPDAGLDQRMSLLPSWR
jgi:hypothetical protein